MLPHILRNDAGGLSPPLHPPPRQNTGKRLSLCFPRPCNCSLARSGIVSALSPPCCSSRRQSRSAGDEIHASTARKAHSSSKGYSRTRNWGDEQSHITRRTASTRTLTPISEERAVVRIEHSTVLKCLQPLHGRLCQALRSRKERERERERARAREKRERETVVSTVLLPESAEYQRKNK